MKSGNEIFQLLLASAFCILSGAICHAQLSDIPWKAAEQIRNRGNNQIEYNDEGLVTKIVMKEIPSGLVMGQLEVFPLLESVKVDSRYYFEDSNMGGVRKLKNLKEFSIKNSRYASSALLELLAEAPALEKLTIENCGEISSLHELTRIRRLEHLVIIPDDAMSFTPLVECKNLKKLQLYKSETIDDTALADVARVKSLQSIDLSQTQVTDEGLAELGKLPKLEKLVLEKCGNVTGSAFAEFAFPQVMKDINLEQARKFNDDGLSELRRFVNLEHLRLQGSKEIRGRGFECLASMANLKTLKCPGSTISDAHLELLDGIESLEMVWLPECKGVSGKGLEYLSRSANVSVLNLNGCRKIDSPDFDVISKFGNLESLYLNKTRIRNKNIEKLCQLKQLRLLKIEESNWLDDEAFEKLQDCSVAKLYATGLPRLSDKSFEVMGRMENLEELHITASKRLNGTGFREFASNEKMKRITVESPEYLSLEALAHLSKIPNLEELTFSEGKITVAQLEQLAGMENLNRLKYKVDDSMTGSERLIAILKTFPKLNK